MESEVKYFKSRAGHVVSNGKVKVKFPITIISTDKKEQIALLEKSKQVTEVTKEEAVKTYPQKFTDEMVDDGDDEGSNNSGMTRKELEEEALNSGVSEEELKKAKNKGEVAALLKAAQEKAAENV